jgi:hypothetical protein
MESLFLLAFSEEEFLTALAMASSEAFFNKLLVDLIDASGAAGDAAEILSRLSREFEGVPRIAPHSLNIPSAPCRTMAAAASPPNSSRPARNRTTIRSCGWRSLKLNGASSAPNTLTPRSVICEDDGLRFR